MYCAFSGISRPERVLHRPHRRDRVHRRADAAEALGEEPRVARVAPLQDVLDPAEHLARRPGVLHAAAVHLDVDAEVAFDAGDRVDGDSLAIRVPLSSAPARAAGAPARIGNVLTMTTYSMTSRATIPKVIRISGTVGK